MDDVAGIFAREFDYLDRYVQLGVAQGRVISVSFPETVEDDAGSDHELLDRIGSYLEGTEDTFEDVTVALTVPTDQRKVLEKVREIPYGEQHTVDELATVTVGLSPDDDEDRALVREALSENPAPLLIPDHRIRDGPSAAPPSVEQKLRAVEGL